MFLTSPFTHGYSLLHRLDPRLKLVIALLFAITLAISMRLTTLLSGLGVALLLTVIAQLPALPLFKRLLTLNLFTLLIFLVLPMTTPGPVYWTNGHLIITSTGLLQATLITLKSNAILLAFTALVSTIEITTLGQALYQLNLSPKLIHLLLFTVRYIAVFHQEYQRLTQAMKIRGFQPRFNRHTYRSLAYLIGMLLVKSLDRSERILAAMKCRGFQERLFLLQPFSWQLEDTLFSILAIFSLSSLLGIEWL